MYAIRRLISYTSLQQDINKGFRLSISFSYSELSPFSGQKARSRRDYELGQKSWSFTQKQKGEWISLCLISSLNQNVSTAFSQRQVRCSFFIIDFPFMILKMHKRHTILFALGWSNSSQRNLELIDETILSFASIS